MPDRQNALNNWLKQIPGLSEFTLKPLAGDASFRRYLRLQYKDGSRIVMDAPPDKEPLRPFIAIAGLLRANGIRAPHLFAADETLGFALLDDFGDRLLQNELSADTADTLYQLAIKTLVTLQQCPTASPHPLSCFDSAFILNELNLFRHWFLQAYLKMTLTEGEKKLVQQTFDWLCQEIGSQPKVFVHRDYHSRNIMLTGDKNDQHLGIIDFQDAMLGPFTYDLVSLLKDCYIQWPADSVLKWLSFFYEQSAVAKQYPLPSFIRAFDLCGLQRHLKVLGIFSRLYLRDHKPNYLRNLPLTFHYVLACLEIYEELRPFYLFMQQKVQLP